MRTVKSVLFDFAGTLCYGTEFSVAGLARAARDLGVSLDDEEATRIWTDIMEQAHSPEEAARRRDLSEDAFRRSWLRLFGAADHFAPGLGKLLYGRAFDANNWHAFPDARPVLQRLADRGLTTAVLSNVGWDIRPIFDRELLGLITTFVLSFEVGAVKPDQEMFRAACERLRCAPHETLMVGDRAPRRWRRGASRHPRAAIAGDES